MAFEWPRMHKWEDNIESQVTDAVNDYVMEFYGVSQVEELTREMIDEIDTFRNEELNEYSLMQVGFSNLVSSWESEMWEEENE